MRAPAFLALSPVQGCGRGWGASQPLPPIAESRGTPVGRWGHRLPAATQGAGGREGSKCPALFPSWCKFLPERSHLPPRALPSTLPASSGVAVLEPMGIHTFSLRWPERAAETERLKCARPPPRLSPAPPSCHGPRSIQRKPKAEPGAVLDAAGPGQDKTGRDRHRAGVSEATELARALLLLVRTSVPRKVARAPLLSAPTCAQGVSRGLSQPSSARTPEVPSLLSQTLPEKRGVPQEIQSVKGGTCPHRTPRDPAISERRTVPSPLFDGPSAGATGCVGLEQQADLGTLNGLKGSGSRQTSALLPGQPLKGTHPPFPLKAGPLGRSCCRCVQSPDVLGTTPKQELLAGLWSAGCHISGEEMRGRWKRSLWGGGVQIPLEHPSLPRTVGLSRESPSLALCGWAMAASHFERGRDYSSLCLLPIESKGC